MIKKAKKYADFDHKQRLSLRDIQGPTSQHLFLFLYFDEVIK